LSRRLGGPEMGLDILVSQLSIAHMATANASGSVWSSVMLGWLNCSYKDVLKYVSLLQTNTHSCKASFTIWLWFFWWVYIIPYFLSSKRAEQKSLRVHIVLDMWCSVKGLVVRYVSKEHIAIIGWGFQEECVLGLM